MIKSSHQQHLSKGDSSCTKDSKYQDHKSTKYGNTFGQSARRTQSTIIFPEPFPICS